MQRSYELFRFFEELIQQDLSGCRVWGRGRIPADQKVRLEDTKEKWKQLMGGVLGFRGKQAPNQLTGIGSLNPALHWYGNRVASIIEFSVCLFSVLFESVCHIFSNPTAV